MNVISLKKWLVLDLSRFVFSRKEAIIWSLFVLIYLLSGLLFVSPLPYRMAVISIPYGLLTFILFRFRVNGVTLVYLAMLAFIVISALINGSTLFRTLYFMRVPTFAYFTYYVVWVCAKEKSLWQIVEWGRVIGLIQLPVIILQWLTFPYWRASTLRVVQFEDSGFGTFYFKTDYSIVIFMLFHIIILLFLHKESRLSNRARILWITWFTLTIFIARAQFGIICLLLIFGYYFFRHYAVSRITIPVIATIFIIAVISGLLSLSNNPLLEQIPGSLSLALQKFVNLYDRFLQDRYDLSLYLSGGYDRVGAIIYLLFENPSLIGEGPALYDPAVGVSRRGNFGHFLDMISNIGFVGAFISALFFFFIAGGLRSTPQTPNKQTAIRLVFWVTMLCGLVYPIMNDIGVVFSYTTIMAYLMLDNCAINDQGNPNFGPTPDFDQT